MHTYLGIDIGGSGFKYGWGNSQSGLQYFSSVALKNKTMEAFQAAAAEVLKETEQRFGLARLSGIGIGTPGTIDLATGLITGVNPNLHFWTGRDPRELIPADLQLPVKYDNDANLMALAEAKACGKRNMLGITVGSGIGCGIIINGAVHHGAHGFAGELGHVCVVENGAKCNCGRLGCLESYCSVDGIRNRLAEQHPRYADFSLSQMLSLRASDPLVQDYIQEGLKILCASIARLIVVCDPEAIILGGGAMDLGLYSLQDLKAETGRNLPELNLSRTELKTAVHGNRAGVLGAIMLFENGN